MELSWDWYKVFYYVANEKQISKAAKKLFISQPAVSQSIKLLEESLGFSLFIRTPKGVNLTNQGIELFDSIKKVYILIKNTENKIKELNDEINGEIRFGASDTLCKHYLIKYLKTHRELYPKVRMHVFNMTTDEIIKSLQSGEIDLGFINLPNKITENIELKKIQTLQDCFICGENLKNNFLQSISISELSKYPILSLEKGTNMRRFLDKFFMNYGIDYQPELELGSIDILTKFAAADFGVSFVTKNFIEKELNNDEVFLVNVNEHIPERSIGIIKIKDNMLTKTVKNFYDLF